MRGSGSFGQAELEHLAQLLPRATIRAAIASARWNVAFDRARKWLPFFGIVLGLKWLFRSTDLSAIKRHSTFLQSPVDIPRSGDISVYRPGVLHKPRPMMEHTA